MMPSDAVRAYCMMENRQGNDRGLELCVRRVQERSMQGYIIPRRISLARVGGESVGAGLTT